ncbi:MAG: type I restriction endonuclease [Cyanobacteria bacterium J06588_5]
MAQTIAARKIKLHDLKARFGLKLMQDEAFFTEWCEDLSPSTAEEQRALDRIKRNYLYLLEYPVMESIVKMVVLSLLLDLAGFYEPPFRVDGERNIKVSAEDEGEVIQGYIDVVVIQGQIWVTTIEAKNSEFSITKAIPQTLAYMLAAPDLGKPAFGVVMNGSEFLFLKLVREEAPLYATSNLFSLLNRGNDLYQVLSVLKQFRKLAIVLRK